MPVALLAFAFLWKPVWFPLEPISSEIARGADLQQRGRPIDDASVDDGAVLGRWFDGHVHRAVEEVVWLSPSLTSRYLGYLAAEKGWKTEETNRRWTRIRARFEGTVSLLVKMATLERGDFLDMGVSGRTAPEELTDPLFALTVTGTKRLDLHPVSVEKLLMLECREPGPLLDVPWYATSQLLSDFRPATVRAVDPSDWLPLGDNYEAFYLVQFAAAPEIQAANWLNIRVTGPGKIRTARIRMARLDKREKTKTKDVFGTPFGG